jgi:hypothetical protein
MATKIEVHARTITAAASMATAVMIAFSPTAAAADTALILGGTGLPTPPQSYVDAVEHVYLIPRGLGGYTPQVVTTPEQAYPITGVNSISVDTSAAQGVTALDDAIKTQLAAGPDPANNHVVVFGYSQGAAVASQEAAQLAASSNPPSPDQLSFILVGDPSNPNGGINQRFQVPGAPLSLPSLGTTFNNAPAVSNTYPTANYTQEYDGFADFPQYPINLLADLNAYVGIFTQHFSYVDLTPEQMNSAIVLPTEGNTTTTYYMIPTPNLPLLVPVRLIPLIGNPLADLLQPDLRVLVNLGYGSIDNGWSPGPANVPTPIGLFPTNINPVDVVTALAKGIPQGVTNALNDLKSPTLFDFSSLSGFLAGFNTVGFTQTDSPSVLQVLAGFTAFGNGGVPVSNSGGVVNTLTGVISQDIAVVKPLADSALALGVSLPLYDAELFGSQLAAGNLVNAVGLPIAADLGLAPYVLIAGAAFPIIGAAATTVTQLAELTGLEPNPTAAAASTASIQTNTATVAPKVASASVSPQDTPSTPKGSSAIGKITPVIDKISPLISKINTVTGNVNPQITSDVRAATGNADPQGTPKVSAVTSKINAVTTKVTAKINAVTSKLSSLSPKVTASTTSSGTQTNKLTSVTAKKSAPAANTTKPGSPGGNNS